VFRAETAYTLKIPTHQKIRLHTSNMEDAMTTKFNPKTTLKPLALIVLLSSCAAIQPWERGNLAKPQMALDPYPLQSALRAHSYGSREAEASGNAAHGGGCGCY
jgi:hypothetical protein